MFDKQIIPILTYGSTFWGISDNYYRLYIYIHNIPESVKTNVELQTKLKCWKDIIKSFKRVGRKSDTPRRIIVTTESYEAKLWLLHNLTETEDISECHFDKAFEQVQTKFGKFVLNIAKSASNHAIRAELGRFPLSLFTDLKLVKYWHRLENLEDNSILKECVKLSKLNNHSMYVDIYNMFKRNGLAYFCEDFSKFSISNIYTSLKKKLEDQYLQNIHPWE